MFRHVHKHSFRLFQIPTHVLADVPKICRWMKLSLTTLTVFFLTVVFFYGQTADAATPEEIFAQFLEVREKLEGELQQLDAEHANDSVEYWRDVVRGWHERNAARVDAQAERGELLRKAVEARVPDTAPLPALPADLPADVRDFLREAREGDAAIKAILARWKNSTPEQRRDAVRTWHEQHVDWLAAQKARAEIVRERVEAQLNAQPLVTVIPVEASAQLRELLTLQADLDDGAGAVADALKGASPERIRDAVRDWHDHHRAEFERLQALREKVTEAPAER